MTAGFPENWPKAPWHSPDGTPLTTIELQTFAHESGDLFGDGTPKDYYLPKWRNILDGQASRAGFNKAALFIGHTWCFWRRQWLLGLFVIIEKRGGTSIWGIVLGLAIAFVSFIANVLTMN